MCRPQTEKATKSIGPSQDLSLVAITDAIVSHLRILLHRLEDPRS